jgi:outer membrane protein TolC
MVPVLVVVLALAALPAGLQAQVSLTTIVELAQQKSAPVRIAEANVRKAEAQLSESKDTIIPSIQFGTGIPTFPEVGFTGTPPSLWSMTIQSLVFGVPQKRYIDSARLGVKVAFSRLEDAREQVALDASLAYLELDTDTSELAAVHQQEQDAARLIDIEQERTEAGVDPLSDFLQARLTAAQIRLKRLQLEARIAELNTQLAALTGLPPDSILPAHASIPKIPHLAPNTPVRTTEGVHSAQLFAESRQQAARGDEEINYFPQLNFVAQYNRNTTILNSVNSFFAKPLPTNNFFGGVSIQIPLFDMGRHAKSRESAADALEATVQAEEAQHQNDLQIAQLTGSLRQLDTVAEIASLKQQIAHEQLTTVQSQLQLGNGAESGPNPQPQLSPKAAQLARIDESQKYDDALDAQLDLDKAELNLLRALGHMQDWLDELHAK